MPYKEMDAFSVRNQVTSTEIAELMGNGRRRTLTRGQEMGQEVTMGQEVEPEATTGNQFPVTTAGKRDIFPEIAEERGRRGRERVQVADLKADLEKFKVEFKTEMMEMMRKRTQATGFQ